MADSSYGGANKRFSARQNARCVPRATAASSARSLAFVTQLPVFAFAGACASTAHHALAARVRPLCASYVDGLPRRRWLPLRETFLRSANVHCPLSLNAATGLNR